MHNSIHEPGSVEDALTMLDSRIPLTYAERKFVVQGLYDLAFREGARQGRLAGTEAAQAEILHGEYTDPTASIREHLTEKARTRDQFTTTENFTAAYPER